ncbi:MAG: hypothetical protein A3K19_24395 [Lentisphaerae bacterium RIFOXYB12_FULL_65_16]|nr:MAG: hypothetical protein A3K18_05480 [Lentisphaerae bacterium RIFOXYA12_64_32]OGV90591.1 MAG: hypothetical protein A3K19_24395 [Lentisphaerae bacterium RIFOXYB12_FULL_65_16]
MAKLKFIFTNDDAAAADGAKPVQEFAAVVEWLDSQGIPGTFFTVPCGGGGKPACERIGWVEAIRTAASTGHDFQLHGYRHDSCLEFGVPQESTRVANPKPFDEYARNTAKWQGEHSVESLSAKIRHGMQIMETLLPGRPVVFRAPCFGMCDNAYAALKQNGILYSSSRGVNPTATASVITGRADLRLWKPDYLKPVRQPNGVLELPCMEDLVIAGTGEGRYREILDLFKSELAHYLEGLGGAGYGIFGSHYQSMFRTWDQTRRLYEELFGWLRDQGVTEWVTFAQAVAEIESCKGNRS